MVNLSIEIGVMSPELPHAILRRLSAPATVRKAAFRRPGEQALAKQLAPFAARRRRAANEKVTGRRLYRRSGVPPGYKIFLNRTVDGVFPLYKFKS